MRLLRMSDGKLSLTEFYSNEPPYAVLSHLWGPDEQEVTYKDVMEGQITTQEKPGYNKLRFCAEQASKDGLKYFWIDTCCIDKSSSAELSEAINSMFRWYRNAAKCYVYLADVSSKKYKADRSCFQKSRWFKRGWTLQELLAPKEVEFFTADSQHIGDRSTLLAQIKEATGISVEALQGCPLPYFTVSERLSWAEKRTTKRAEDAAYSLLGILDVYMPLIYGEGVERAMFRLQHETQLFETRRYSTGFRFIRQWWPQILNRHHMKSAEQPILLGSDQTLISSVTIWIVIKYDLPGSIVFNVFVVFVLDMLMRLIISTLTQELFPLPLVLYSMFYLGIFVLSYLDIQPTDWSRSSWWQVMHAWTRKEVADTTLTVRVG